MSGLSVASWAMGGAMLVLCLPSVAVPGRFRAWVQAFPRNRVAGWVLTGAGLAWATYYLVPTPFGRFEPWKPLLYVAAPVLYVLIVNFMDELLAARALGGILLLVAEPILRTARLHDSAWRLALVVIAYSLIVKGVVLVLSPYYFRRGMSLWVNDERRCRALGIVGVGVAAGLVGLGFVF
jgi:hypothetical protein